MKRLFTVNGKHFDSKADAKAERGKFIQGGSCVSRGPDHWRFGLKRTGTTHSNQALKKR